MGVTAPAHLWHVFHPEDGIGEFEGEELVVLLLRLLLLSLYN